MLKSDKGKEGGSRPSALIFTVKSGFKFSKATLMYSEIYPHFSF